MKIKKSGFTLIETLTVLVVVAILAGFSVATFRVYIAKSQDSYRLGAIKNMGVIIKAHGFRSDAPNFADVDDDSVFSTADPVEIGDIAAVLGEQDYYLPKQEIDTCYLYGYESQPAEHDDFLLLVQRKDENAPEGDFIYDGTEGALKEAKNITAMSCASGSEGVTGGSWTNYTWLNLTPL